MTAPTLTTLVSGGSAVQREIAISRSIALLPTTASVAFILEGLSSAESPLHQPAAKPEWRLRRIAPGCPCCIGNLTMRVTLNRLLRPPPQHLLISLASTAHLAQVRAFLLADPYDKLLCLQPDLVAS